MGCFDLLHRKYSKSRREKYEDRYEAIGWNLNAMRNAGSCRRMAELRKAEQVAFVFVIERDTRIK